MSDSYVKMGDRKHAPKRGAQNINNSLTNSPVKSVQSKIKYQNVMIQRRLRRKKRMKMSRKCLELLL